MQIKDMKARYNSSGNAIIPNTFQHPNIFVDRLMAYLSPEENIVLTYAVRRILGFQENIMSRKDHISLSQFVDGLQSKDGKVLSLGCGLGANAVRAALAALLKFNILLPTTDKADPKKGQEFWLQDNENAVDWDGLEARLVSKRLVDAKRTKRARCVVRQHTVVRQHKRCVVGQHKDVLWDNNTKPIETQGNPVKAAPDKPPALKANQIPEVVLFREVTLRYPPRANFDDVVSAVQKMAGRLRRDVTKDDLFPFYKTWTGRGYKENALGWLDWVISGNIPTKPGRRGNGDNRSPSWDTEHPQGYEPFHVTTPEEVARIMAERESEEGKHVTG